MAKILIVEDEKSLRKSLAIMLTSHGHEVQEAEDGKSAKKAILESGFDLMITDLLLGDIDGIEVLKFARQNQPFIETIVVTAFATVNTAVEAMKAGAYDYIQKPFSEEELLIKIEKAVEKKWLSGQILKMAEELREKYHFENIVGRSSCIKEVLTRIIKFASADSTILITGESGTGKELVARAIHANSPRANHSFVPVNCAAIPEELLESELMGHVRGAFTGAVTTRRGLLEEANGGTFFFDEIAETTPSFQAKLLRVIEDQEIRRVGDNKPIKVNVRVIAATNRDIEKCVEEKSFRADLFYRLNVGRIHLAPLRERKEDIPLLVEHFLKKFQKKFGKNLKIKSDAMERLYSYDYPGNVRELENIIEQAVLLAVSDTIDLESLPLPKTAPLEPTKLKDRIEQLERIMIQAAVEKTNSLSEAASILGLSTTTLWRKIKRYRIEMKKVFVVNSE